MRGNSFLARWARLYAHPTTAELTLEPAVAALGFVYRFQHPLFGLGAIPDFAVFPRGAEGPVKWAFEVDGASHFTTKGRAKDAERTAKLEKAGWVVVRCTNEEAIAHPAETVARMVAEAQSRS